MRDWNAYYREDGTLYSINEYLKEVASVAKRPNMSVQYRILITKARNILYNSGQTEFVRDCDKKDQYRKEKISVRRK